MAWTAELIKFEKQDGNVVATVRFTDGAEIITHVIPGDGLSMDRLGGICAGRIQGFMDRNAAFDTLALGPIAIPGKPQEEVLADEFFATLTDLRQLEKQVNLGIIKDGDATLLSAQATVKALFLPEYTKDFRFG